ncbi:hypothetical protein [Streptomyces sp. NPDC056227]|uniref:hypothetical protein n=1 Tax=Streptomyces sp. NPDC056227 TaxID=3345753 RepID=UPI0035E30058
MKCNEPYPEGTYEECHLDLRHSGDHEYYGKAWPRLELGELDPDVDRLIRAGAKARHAWGMDDRTYPVVIERTITYVYWAEGESEEDALAAIDGDAWEISLDNEDSIDCSHEVRRIDKFERDDAFKARHYGDIGPQIQCPGCGKDSFRREWYHDPLRKCHGPIQWRENAHATQLSWRWRREHKATPSAVTA